MHNATISQQVEIARRHFSAEALRFQLPQEDAEDCTHWPRNAPKWLCRAREAQARGLSLTALVLADIEGRFTEVGA